LEEVVRGCVWAQLVSPFDYPVARVDCQLVGAGREWSPQKTTDEGEVFWHDLPLDEYYLELKLGERTLDADVPWMREKYAVHYERLIDADDLLGGDGSPRGIQVRLLGLGYDCGQIDGVIGSKTKEAIKQFQTDHGLDVDGIAGPEIQEILADIFGV